MTKKVSHIRVWEASRPGYWISRVAVQDDCGETLFACWALEDADECPPVGKFKLELEYSPKFRMKLYEMKDVPGRKEIKYHDGNTLAHTEGCPLLGSSYKGPRVLGSDIALDGFMAALKGTEKTTVEISVQ